jgi:predicted regulator of Ras-like GTPase activity (Roadblock/LC7/MglB family)
VSGENGAVLLAVVDLNSILVVTLTEDARIEKVAIKALEVAAKAAGILNSEEH